jgi:NAD dependent epimerase/dehydratase family enzyme
VDVIATGQRVLPRRGIGLGYMHKFPELEAALQDLLGSPNR